MCASPFDYRESNPHFDFPAQFFFLPSLSPFLSTSFLLLPPSFTDQTAASAAAVPSSDGDPLTRSSANKTSSLFFNFLESVATTPAAFAAAAAAAAASSHQRNTKQKYSKISFLRLIVCCMIRAKTVCASLSLVCDDRRETQCGCLTNGDRTDCNDRRSSSLVCCTFTLSHPSLHPST